jgi:hypothetical protein
MPQATGQFEAGNVVALFQGFFNNNGNANPNLQLTTRAAQNCSVQRTGVGQYCLFLANVTTDDCNFMPQVTQFVYAPLETPLAVQVAFPPVADVSAIPPLVPNPLQTYNYIQFGFYSSGGTPTDPNVYGLFNISVFSCNDGLVGVRDPSTGAILRTPGNP